VPVAETRTPVASVAGAVPSTFRSTMTGIDIVLDEEGQTLLRNISVNSKAMTK
jgi:hypothetical protein